jgi:2'-hydroxyisoflavone reductase
LAWFQTLPAERQAKLKAGIDPTKEKEALAAGTNIPSRPPPEASAAFFSRRD